MRNEQLNVVGRLVISALVTALGATSMVMTDGQSGCGWAILGLVMIWS